MTGRVAAGGARRSEIGLLTGFLSAFPLIWLLGVGELAWLLVAFMMAFTLLGRQVDLPVGAGWWLALSIWIVGSVVGVGSDPGRLLSYAVRSGYFLAAGIFVAYLVTGAGPDARARVVRALLRLWFAVIVGGWAGIFFGNVSYRSPLLGLLPGGLAGHAFVEEILTVQFAEVQRVGGIELARPAAPFLYTNLWASALAALTPFALVVAVSGCRAGVSRRRIQWGLVASLVPAIASLNRGLWLSFGVLAVYALASGALGRIGARRIRLAGAGLVLGGAAILLSPLGSYVRDGLDARTEDSNEVRASLIEEAIDRSWDSPLLGHGTLQPSSDSTPPVGSHGLSWFLLFSYGYIGLGLFCAYFATILIRTRARRDPISVWCRASILVVAIQMPFYGQLPVGLMVAMISSALLVLPDAAPRASSDLAETRQPEAVA